MTTSAIAPELGKQIEQLVQEHIAAVRRTAVEAVERAITGRGVKADSPARRVKRISSSKVGPRSPQELSLLSERFYAVVCTHPGETMATLAEEMKVTSLELRSAVRRLRSAGRIRTVGQRQDTRYFPIAVRPTVEG